MVDGIEFEMASGDAHHYLEKIRATNERIAKACELIETDTEWRSNPYRDYARVAEGIRQDARFIDSHAHLLRTAYIKMAKYLEEHDTTAAKLTEDEANEQ